MREDTERRNKVIASVKNNLQALCRLINLPLLDFELLGDRLNEMQTLPACKEWMKSMEEEETLKQDLIDKKSHRLQFMNTMEEPKKSE